MHGNLVRACHKTEPWRWNGVNCCELGVKHLFFFFLISKEHNILTKKGQALGYTRGIRGIQGAQQEYEKKEV